MVRQSSKTELVKQPNYDILYFSLASLVAQIVNNLPAMQETWVQSLDWEDPREGNGNPLQYSCLENPMDRGAWQATVQGVTKNWTRLQLPLHFTSLHTSLWGTHPHLQGFLHCVFQFFSSLLLTHLKIHPHQRKDWL